MHRVGVHPRAWSTFSLASAASPKTSRKRICRNRRGSLAVSSPLGAATRSHNSSQSTWATAGTYEGGERSGPDRFAGDGDPPILAENEYRRTRAQDNADDTTLQKQRNEGMRRSGNDRGRKEACFTGQASPNPRIIPALSPRGRARESQPMTFGSLRTSCYCVPRAVRLAAGTLPLRTARPPPAHSSASNAALGNANPPAFCDPRRSQCVCYGL